MQKENIKLGVIYGVIGILLMGITYMTSPKSLMSLSHWSTVLGLVLMVGFAYYAAKSARDRKGGFIPFGEALVPAVVVLAIGNLLSTLFMYLLVNFIDPSLGPLLNEAALEMSDSMLDMAGATEEMKMQAREEAERQQEGSSPFGLMQSIIGWFVSLIFPILPIAAIVAAIVKKQEPMLVV